MDEYKSIGYLNIEDEYWTKLFPIHPPSKTSLYLPCDQVASVATSKFTKYRK